MADPTEPPPLRRILAAGGILWRDRGRSALCIVHRARHRDCVLPKGKLEPGERFLDAARRELREETGWDAERLDFAGELLYRHLDRDKSVLFWHFVAIGDAPVALPDPEEVAAVEWVDVPTAVERLTWDDERRLVRGG